MTQLGKTKTRSAAWLRRGLGTIRWQVRDVWRLAVWRLHAEPVPGIVGWGFIASSAAIWLLAEVYPLTGLLYGLFNVEAMCLTAAGLPAVLLSWLIRWWRGW